MTDLCTPIKIPFAQIQFKYVKVRKLISLWNHILTFTGTFLSFITFPSNPNNFLPRTPFFLFISPIQTTVCNLHNNMIKYLHSLYSYSSLPSFDSTWFSYFYHFTLFTYIVHDALAQNPFVYIKRLINLFTGFKLVKINWYKSII